MAYNMKSEKTIGRMVSLRENDDVAEYVALEKQLTKDKKEDSLMLVGKRESGEIKTNEKFTNGLATVYFREVEKVVTDDDGKTKLTNAQVQAIAQLFPDLIKSVLTPAVIDEAIKASAGKRSEDAKTIQSINRMKVIKTVYQAVIGEAKN